MAADTRMEPALTIQLPGGVEMSFQRIPAGEFRMGGRDGWDNEEPVHRVRLTEAFYLGTFPVTQLQFAAWAHSERIEHVNHFAGRDENPAEYLDWHQATAFCDWLTRSESLPEGWNATLPTEAQWEYACRAGTDTEYQSGDGEAALREVGWFQANSGGETHPVGELDPNRWGLYDMHGNVNEWCLDVWDLALYRRRLSGVCDPVRKELPGDDADLVGRVYRGGSYFHPARYCRAAYRYWRRPGARNGNHGLRVCLLPGPAAGQAEAPDGDRK